MTIRPDPTTLVPINSYRGVDGSVSPLKLADGFCRDLENADLTTAGVIKKRGGYATCGGRLPVNGVYYQPNFRVLPADIRPYLLKAIPLTAAAGLKKLSEEIGYVQFPTNMNTRYFLAEFWSHPQYTVTKNTLFTEARSGTWRCAYAPIEVYGNKYALFAKEAYDHWLYFTALSGPSWATFSTGTTEESFDLTPSSGSTTYVIFGTQGYKFSQYPVDEITSMVVADPLKATFYTSLPLPKGAAVRFMGTSRVNSGTGGASGSGIVTDTDNLTYFTVKLLATQVQSTAYDIFSSFTLPLMKIQYDMSLFWDSYFGASGTISSVCYSLDLNLYCAVQSAGSPCARVVISSDGINWDASLSPTNSWTSVCWGKTGAGGRFCAVANSGTGNRVMTSPDGITWTNQTSASNQAWSSVCWSSTNQSFCAVSSGAAATDVMVSTDLGVSWTAYNSGTIAAWTSVCWSQSLGIFCAVANSGAGNRAMFSTAGSSWTSAAIDSKAWTSVCWSPDLNLFCAVAYGGTASEVNTSSNGSTWNAQTTPAGYTWTSIIWSTTASKFIAVSDNSRIMTSANGTAWSDSFMSGTTMVTLADAGPGVGIVILEALTTAWFSLNGTAWTTCSTYVSPYNTILGDNSEVAAFSAPTTYANGTGIDSGDVSTVDNFYNVLEDTNQLCCVSNGAVFKKSINPPFQTALSVDSPPAFTSAGSVALINGTFNIPFTNANTYYQTGDGITQVTLDESGTLTSSLQLTVVSASATHLVVTAPTGTTTVSYRAGEVWDYTRSSTKISFATALGTSISTPYGHSTVFCLPVSGDTIFFGGIGKEYSAHELWYAEEIVTDTRYCLIFAEAITFSSGMYLYIDSRWTQVSWPVEEDGTQATYGPNILPHDSEITSSVAYSGSCFFTDRSSGVYRINGPEVHALSLPRPQIRSIRSIPQTKGRFPIRVGPDGQKIGKQVEAVFVFSFFDATNRIMESEYSEMSEGIFSPKASVDGSDYAELVEYLIEAPPIRTMIPHDKIQLDTYLRIVDPSVNAELDYVFYRSTLVETKSFGSRAISVVVGDIPPEYLAGNKLLYSMTEGLPHWAAPRAKYLTSVSDRLIALNCQSEDYIKLKCLKVFDINGHFAAFTQMHMQRQTSGGFPLFFTFPLGVIQDGTATPVTFRPVRNKTDIPASTCAYPTADYSDFITCSLDYTQIWGGTYGCSIKGDSGTRTDLRLTYGDTSDRFTLSSDAGLALTNYVKFRFPGTSVPQGLPIDFLGDAFKVFELPTGSTAILRGSTRWTDAALDSAGLPVALRNTNALQFIDTGSIHQESIAAGDYRILIDTSSGGTRIFYASKASMTTEITPTAAQYVVLQGPGTFGNLSKTGTSNILSFDRDLTFLASTPTPATLEIDDNAGTSVVYNLIELTPVTLSLDAASAYVATAYNVTTVGISSSVDTPFPIQIFQRANITSPVTFSGFTLPATSLTVRSATAAVATTFCAVGDYLVFELADEDVKAIPQGFPRLMPGAFRVKAFGDLGVGAAPDRYYITLEVPYSPEFRMATAATTDVYLGEFSYVVNTKKLIWKPSTYTMTIVVQNGAQPYGAADRTVVTTFANHAFLCVRGADYSSVCHSLTGYYANVSAAVYASTDSRASFAGLGAGSIDYSLITGVRYSTLTIANTGAATLAVPVPCPLKRGTADSLTDLALPAFSKDPTLTDVGYVQVGKRITSALNTIWSNYTYAYTSTNDAGLISVEPNEIGIKIESDQTRYSQVYTNQFTITTITTWFQATNTFTDSYFQVTNSKLVSGSYLTSKTIFGGTHSSTTTTGRVITDLYPNRVQWTLAASDTVASPNVPMFSAGNSYSLETQDDSEILGAAAFQNTLIVQKKFSMWRGTFDKYGNLTFQRIQSPVGGYGHNNMISTLSYMYFVNPEGVFEFDGTAVEPVFKLNQLFENNVSKSQYLLSRTSGYVDHKNKQAYIGVPYTSQYITDTAEIDGQFNYSYNDGVLGWQVNKGIDAYKWTSLDGEYYFASSRGRVFRMRSEPFLTRYRDGEAAIPFVLSTRFLTAEETVKFKFWRNVLFQFGTTSDFNMSVSYQLDFKSAVYPLETYPITGATSVFGAKWYGNDRIMKALRETFGQRVNQISFLFTESTLDTDSPIYSVNVEGLLTNTRLVPQKNTRAGGTR